MALKWTTEKPKEPGKYWFEERTSAGRTFLGLVDVTIHCGRLWVAYHGTEEDEDLDAVDLVRCAGPIPMPEG